MGSSDSMRIRASTLAIPVVLAVLSLRPFARAGYLDAVGYTQLAQELGSAVPTGAGAHVAHVEKAGPDTNDPQFAGKTFTCRGGMKAGAPLSSGLSSSPLCRAKRDL